MKTRNRSIRFGLLLSAASLSAVASYAAAPPAGSKIGNQASATYVNASGDTISVTSNKVETIVQQVAGLTLLTDNTEDVSPGGKVFLPHTITNEGNGTDSYSLTAVDADTGGITFTNITIFPDANFDGVADSTTPISVTPVLAAGTSFGFVIEATVQGNSTGTETINVNAVSQFDGSVLTTPGGTPGGTRTNVDTITVSSGAITEIVKAMTVADTSGDGVTGPGDTVTVTLTYSSTGLAAANDLIVTDKLNQFLTYVPGSGRWSDVGSAPADALSDGEDAATPPSTVGYEASNGNGFQIAYDYDNIDTVKFQIDSVPSGRTATVTFKATIDADAPAGDIPNVATQTVAGAPFPPSNQANVTVQPVYRVTAADGAASTYAADPDGANLNASVRSATDDNGLDDVVIENGQNGAGDETVFQGASIKMEFVITNHANVDDTINLTVANDATNGFPDGTTFQLVGADGATPIVGPLGPLATGASAKVNIIAKLPANAPVTAAGSTNYEVDLTAQSVNGGPANSTTGRFIGAVLGATVDLENGNGTGDGPDAVGSPVQITTLTNPGVPVSFPLVVQNGGPTADTYDLSLPNPLPPGWTAVFTLADGTPVTNTGVIPGGGSTTITVTITPPADEAPGNTPFQVAILSPTSGQGDTLTNQVTVNEIVDVSLTTDQSVQVAPGGVTDIPHVLSNQGNITLTEGGITAGTGFTTFSGTIFWDVNGDGAVDGGDIVIDNIDDISVANGGTFEGLPAGESISIIHRVQVPSNGAIGVSEAETLTVATSLNGSTKTDGDTGDNSVTDTVTIVSGDMTLVKLQAVDPACDGTTPAGFSLANVQAKPGQCIRYRITADNTGTESAGSVTIKDTIPGFTSLTQCGGDCDVVVTPGGSAVATPAAITDGYTGSLETTHGTLIPGAPATLEFTVKIDE